ncbi:LysE family translocator [Hoeflea poritis]|uniref:LysE family translocator n=1 Tax=Hoeflea poritis TaxID=2993659 RepID=A0ABT4VP20_9HYPH|nr:LysE family translocator [Hoeflea poritis]MDA4846434.1 LysE family translocator [Hoeflea poritis]
MAVDTFLALVTFAFVTSVTPGPNNFMLLASGANFGFARTVPHMFGIAAGFASLLMGVGFGLGTLLQSWPALHLLLKIAGGSYLIYLAWKIAGSRALADDETVSRPVTFLQAAAFQWVNPKAWMMALTAMVLFANPAEPGISVLLVSAAFVVVNFPSVSIWAGFGTVMRRALSSPQHLRWFNMTMGVLLLATLVPMML